MNVPVLAGQLELVRPPAPGRLELVHDFINTRSRSTGRDDIATPQTLAAWLRERGLIARKGRTVVDDAAVARAAGVREALRGWARANNGVADEVDTALLEDAAARAQLTLRFDPHAAVSQVRAGAAGLDGALGTVLAAVHDATVARTWQRLKACADDTCAYAYYDHSKNGCSRWCDDACCNRNKVKRYRERRGKP